MKIPEGTMKMLDKLLWLQPEAFWKAWWKHLWGNVATESHLFSRQTDTRKNIGMKLFAMPGEGDKSEKRPKNNTGILSLLMQRKRVQPKLSLCLNHNIPKQSPGLTVPLKIFSEAAAPTLHHFILKIFSALQSRVKSWGKLNFCNTEAPDGAAGGHGWVTSHRAAGASSSFFPPVPGQVGWRPEQGIVGNRK